MRRRAAIGGVTSLIAFALCAPKAAAQERHSSVYLSAAERDSQRLAHDATRPKIGYRGLHLGMTLADVRALVELVTPIENGCKVPTSSKNIPMSCSLYGRFRSDGSAAWFTFGLTAPDTASPISSVQVRHDFPSLAAAVEGLKGVTTAWGTLRPNDLQIQQRFYAALEEPEVCHARVWLSDEDMSADAKVGCYDLVRRSGPPRLEIGIFDQSHMRR